MTPIYSLRPSVTISECGRRSVRLVRSPDAHITLRGELGSTLRLLSDLRSPSSLDAILESRPAPSERATAERHFHRLLTAGFMIEGSPPLNFRDHSLSRQLSYFALTSGSWESVLQRQDRLRRASVTLIGLGGIGSSIAMALCRAGVGRLVLVDGDVVSETNLNRQLLYDCADIGARKVSVATRKLQSASLSAELVAVAETISTEADFARCAEGSDITVFSGDEPRQHILSILNRGMVRAGHPFLPCGYIGSAGVVGPMVLPHKSPCLSCEPGLLARDSSPKARPLGDLSGHVTAVRASTIPASFGPMCALVGNVAAAEAIRHLTSDAEDAPVTRAHIWLFDMLTLEAQLYPLARWPDCPTCGERG